VLPREAFSAASKKSKDAYKSDADFSKAKTTQLALSLCLHLTTGLPIFWGLGGSADSERGLLLKMLDRLPEKSRLVMDAYYFGFDFWNKLIDQGFSFVVRAGKNIELLNQLGLEGKVKCKGNLVFYWPKNAIDSGSDPIVLSMVEVLVGRKKMFLVTNELSLTDKQLAVLYSKRWGIEVFFRTVKQSFQRAKLYSRTPENAKQELQWTLLGVWIALTEASKHIPSDQRISPVKVLRLFSQLISRVSNVSNLKLSVSQELSQCVLEDETNRKSSKNSDDYPSKKKKPPTGDPNIKPIASELLNRAIQWLF
jgi:hypothetical protein